MFTLQYICVTYCNYDYLKEFVVVAIELKNSKAYSSNGVKMLVYGEAGSGKTSLIKTLKKPLIISVEDGLLSIRNNDIDYISVKSMAEMAETLDYIKGLDSGVYETIVLDSITELALLAHLEFSKDPKNKDGRLAYLDMQFYIKELIRKLKQIPNCNLYVIARLDKEADEFNVIRNSPSMPTKSLSRDIQYYFDEIFALILIQQKDGSFSRSILTRRTDQWAARDNSGCLDPLEPADLGLIINKINGALK